MRSVHEQDYYDVLEVAKDASAEEIDAAYNRLKGIFEESSSATYMLFGDDEAASMRHLLEEAYLTLSDGTLRQRYDSSIGNQRSSTQSQATLSRSTSVTSTTSPLMDAALTESKLRSADADKPQATEELTFEAAAPGFMATEAKAKPAAPAQVSHTSPATSPAAAEAGQPAAASGAQTPQLALAQEQVSHTSQQPANVVVQPSEPRTSMPMVSGPAPDENLEYSGGVLMRVRESKGISLEQIAQRTKISMTHLRAIESNQYEKLPARVYVRGFVSQYAKFLGLSPERVCDSYLQIYDRFVQSRST